MDVSLLILLRKRRTQQTERLHLRRQQMTHLRLLLGLESGMITMHGMGYLFSDLRPVSIFLIKKNAP